HGSTGALGPASRAGSTGTASTMTWALVPLIPNDDTPARRGRAALQGRASVSNDTEPDDQSTCGLGSSTCNVAGNISWRIARTILITPATPAAACVWPMFDLIDPSHSGSLEPRSCPYVANNACASIGSPKVVPVPWPSTTSTSDAASPAFSSAARTTRCCEGPLGAVSPLEAP